MKRRKGLAFILALSLVLSSFSVAFATDVAEETTPVTETTTEAVAPVATATNTAFADIAGHWAKDAIVKWADYGVVKGSDGVFRPDAPLTRAEMATVLSNLMDYKVAAKNNFSDVATGAWYADAVLKANAAGVLSGDGSGLASPSANITREQAISMLARAFAVADANGTSSSLTDTQNISSWARPAVFGMEAAGYVRGFEGKFNPKNNITRAEVMTIINSAVKAYYTAAGTYTENVDGLAVVKVPGVVLKDVVISGNLIAAEGIASGDLTLDGKTEVKGKLIVRGGGENSIIIKGSAAVLSIEVSKVDGKMRIFADGALIKEITALKGEIILEGNFTNVEVKADATVIIKGNVGTLSMESKGTVDIQSGTVTTLDIPAGATATIAANATVTTANITGAADIKGTGAIGTANISGTGATIVQTPTAVNVADGGAATVGGKTVDGATSAAPSTGGGRGNSSNTVAVSAISVDKATLTLTAGGATGTITATVLPVGATNKTVTWTSSNEAVATVAGGVVTPLTAGTTTITATTADGSFTATTTVTVEVIDTEAELKAAVAIGGTVTLGGNITLSSALIVDNTVTLDLNGYTIDTSEGVYVPGECTGVITVDGGNLTIEGPGTVDGSKYDDYAVEVRGGGTVTINGGTFKGSATAVQANVGNVYINGGSFEATPVDTATYGENGYQFTLNCIDANYTAGTARIEVTGGTFYRFNPGDNLSEGTSTNYLAPGYQATADGDNYVVSETPAADQAEADTVDALIAALPETGAVTLENKTQIEAARAAYDALTTEQQALVADVATLEAAEAELAVLLGAAKMAADKDLIEAGTYEIPLANQEDQNAKTAWVQNAVDALIENGTTATVTWNAGESKYDVALALNKATGMANITVTEYKEVIDESKAVVTTVAELKAALVNEKVTNITVKGTIGSVDAYTIYNVNRAVTIQGSEGAKVYGSFIIKADGVTIDNLEIQNKGDKTGESSTNRGGIYVFAENVTLTNNTITNGLGTEAGLSNAIQIMSSKENNPLSSYKITGNKLIGHDNEVTNWSSSGIVIAQGYKPGSIGEDVLAITAELADYQNLLTNNTFENNKIDVQHQDWKADPVVIYPYAITGLTISGEAKVGETLTATIEPSEATATYQWQRSENDETWAVIDGATSSTYTITNDDVGHQLNVRADGKEHYATWWWTSTSTALVADPAIEEANQAITNAIANVGNVELDFGTEVNGENIVAKLPVVDGIEYTAVIKEGSTWTVTVKDTAGKGTPQTKEIEVTVASAVLNITQGTSYETIQAAIDAAVDGDTIQIAAGIYDESVVVPKDDVRSITILGANAETVPTSNELDGTIITGGIYIGTDSGAEIDKEVTVKGITFNGGKGLLLGNIQTATVENNKFLNIEDTFNPSTTNTAAIAVIDPYTGGTIRISNNYIDGVSGLGIYVRRPALTTVIESNHVENTDHNSIQVVGVSAGPNVTIAGNTLINWDQNRDADGGRAIRISFDPVDASTALTVTRNTFTPNDVTDRVDDEYVKITGVHTDAVGNLITQLADENIWTDNPDFATVILVNSTNWGPASITNVKVTTYYDSIGAAVEEVREGETIKLLANASGNGIVVPSGTNFTLDLGGFTYTVDGDTVGSTGTETNGFQLLRDSNITIQNGKITTDKAKILIQNYSNLTLDKVELVGADVTQYVLSNNFGKTTLKNGTTITAVDGQVAFDVYYGLSAAYDAGVSVTIADTDVVINGVYEYGKADRVNDAKWYEKATLIIAKDHTLAALDGYEWVTNTEGNLVLTKPIIDATTDLNAYFKNGNLEVGFTFRGEGTGPEYANYQIKDLDSIVVSIFNGEKLLAENSMQMDKISDTVKNHWGEVSIFVFGRTPNNQWSWDYSAYPLVGDSVSQEDLPTRLVLTYKYKGDAYRVVKDVNLNIEDCKFEG